MVSTEDILAENEVMRWDIIEIQYMQKGELLIVTSLESSLPFMIHLPPMHAYVLCGIPFPLINMHAINRYINLICPLIWLLLPLLN